MLTDPIADMLSRIRNAVMARHDRVVIPASKLKGTIAEVLKSEGYVADVAKDTEESGYEVLSITLKYGKDKAPAIEGIERISKPGRRVYVRAQDIPKVKSGLGIAVLSTSRGIMSDRQARKVGVGGELLCQIW
ncbi:MAG: 30S ribosomal protein S8 [Myxococcales bacterium]|jgi:small subunit ribosomal protein S8|nr:30S ribosomal protein S8 [Myxococcales bacterium]